MVAEITKHPQPLRISATDAADEDLEGIENCWLDITLSSAKISSKKSGAYFSRRTRHFWVPVSVVAEDAAVTAVALIDIVRAPAAASTDDFCANATAVSLADRSSYKSSPTCIAPLF